MAASVGDLVHMARTTRGWSRQELADRTGYSAVMIAKIEAGERAPKSDRIGVLASVLGLDEAELRAAADVPDKRKVGAPKVGDALKLARENERRAGVLRAEAERLELETREITTRLDADVRRFELDVVTPLVGILANLEGVPMGLLFHPAGREADDFALRLADAQERTGRGLRALIDSDVLAADGPLATSGGAPGAAVFATIAGVASAALAAAMRPIASGARVAGTTAKAALAAGSVGFGASAVAATTLAFVPVVGAAVGVAALSAAGRRALTTQQEIAKDLQEVERHLVEVAQQIGVFLRRARLVDRTLRRALEAAANQPVPVPGVVTVKGTPWSSLDEPTQESIRRTVELVLACLTALSLPIGPTLQDGDTSGTERTHALHSSVGGGVLADTPDGEFLDRALDVTYRQVVR